MTSRRRRLHVLCEDALHQRFVEGLADRWSIGRRQRWIDAAPAARGTAAGYVLARYPDAVKRWRSASHDENVGLLVVIDGDEQGLLKRRQQLTEALQRAGVAPIEPSDPVAILTPTWHIETWIAWLCGHRPIDEQTRYKADDPAGREVARKIERGEYSPRQAAERWAPPARGEETHVPALAAGRIEVQRLGV